MSDRLHQVLIIVFLSIGILAAADLGIFKQFSDISIVVLPLSCTGAAMVAVFEYLFTRIENMKKEYKDK